MSIARPVSSVYKHTHPLIVLTFRLYVPLPLSFFLSIFSISFLPSFCLSLCADARGERVEAVCTMERQAQPGGAKMSVKVAQGLHTGAEWESTVAAVYVYVYVNLSVSVCLQLLLPRGSLTGGVMGCTACRNDALLFLLFSFCVKRCLFSSEASESFATAK